MCFDRFDIVEAHYWFCADYHGGLSSTLYRRLSRISEYYTPSPVHRGYDDLSENAQEIYRDLVVRYGFDLSDTL
jgi:hypothetical protein